MWRQRSREQVRVGGSRTPTNFRGCRRWVHPSDARFDPGGALPVAGRSVDRSAGSTSAQIDVEDDRGRTAEGDHMQFAGSLGAKKNRVIPTSVGCWVAVWVRRPTLGQYRLSRTQVESLKKFWTALTVDARWSAKPQFQHRRSLITA